MAAYTQERVLSVEHWNDKLFSFRTTRGSGLRFENGQFVMLGLEVNGRRIARAYSIASPNYEEHLEFYSIKVPNGPLTSALQHIRVGDFVSVSTKPTGTLLLDDVRAGKRLFLLATGTGFAPFASLVRDPRVYERFAQVIVVRGGRQVSDLLYGDSVVTAARQNEFFGDAAREALLDHRSVTREAFPVRGRTTDLLASGRVAADLGIPDVDPASDRFMICGNMRMLADARRWLDDSGFSASPEIGSPGDYVIERAFVDAASTEARPMEATAG